MASPKNGRLNNTSLLANSSLPISQDRPAMKQQSSKMTDVSVSSIASNLGKMAGSFTKSLGNIGQGPFDVTFNTLVSSNLCFHQKWTRFEIVEALIQEGETLRDESYLSVNVLRSYAERV